MSAALLGLLLKYGLSAVIIMAAGTVLVRSGEAIASTLGLGHVWLGSILIASATSLPELVTSIGAARIESYDMALSNIMGSELFNLMVIGIAALWMPKNKPILLNAHARSSVWFNVFLLLVVILFLHVGQSAEWLGLGLASWIILGSYALYIRLTFKEEADENEQEHKGWPFPVHVFLYLLAVAVILIAGRYCVQVSDEIATVSGWGERFVGVLFLALATSLPEFVTTFQACRMGSFKLVFGIVVGSNIFNICILPVCDLFVKNKSLFETFGKENTLTAVLSVIYLIIISVLFLYSPLKRYLQLKIRGLIVIVSYIAWMILAYLFG